MQGLGRETKAPKKELGFTVCLGFLCCRVVGVVLDVGSSLLGGLASINTARLRCAVPGRSALIVCFVHVDVCSIWLPQ